jgi:cytochrome c-type biogenesis protein CcmE
MITVAALVIGMGITAVLLVTAFKQNLMYFYTPTQIANGEAAIDKSIRIGGLVMDGSLKRTDGTLDINFEVTDKANQVPVKYTGILPDLFREGQGIVARGKMNAEGFFVADEILAKHDENYMPPEAQDALDAAKTLKP